MSTKTIYKRIALVAVASLGFGVLTSVSPASATVAAATITDASDKTHLAAAATTAVTFTTTANGETATLTMSVPSGSAITLTDNNGAAAGTVDVFLGSDGTDAETQDDTVFDPATGIITDTTTADDAAGDITITPDVVGTYTFTLTAGATTDTYTVYAADLFVAVADGISSGDEAELTGNGVAGVSNHVTLGFRSQTDARQIRVTGSTVVSVSDATAMTISTDKTTIDVIDNAAADLTFRVATPSVGTITVNAYDEAQGGIFKTSAYGTVTITVAAAAANGAISASASTLTLTASGSGVLATGAQSVSGPRTSAATIGSIAVALSASVGSVLSTNVTTVSITGPGYLTISNGNQNSTGRSLTEVGSDAAWNIAIIGDGTSGTSTVTVTSGAWTATRTVTFFGSASKIVATQKLFNASSAGAQLGNNSAASTAAVSLLVTDSGNTPVSGVTPVVVSSDAAVIASGACTASDITGVSLCHVTSASNTAGKTANVTFKTTVSSVDVVSNALPFTLAGALAKYSIAFAKSTYAPGEKMTLNITGVTSTGGVVFDGSNDVFDTAITPSAAVTNDWTAALAGVTFVKGVGTVDIFAPLASGPFAITVGVASGLQTAVGATTLTASTAVGQNADISAITTLINSLIAKINALNKLVIKIQKKVKA